MIEFLSEPFVQRALVVGVIVGIILAFLGVFVTLKKMSFFVDAIAHSSLAGIALGILIGIDPIIAALVFAVAVAVIMVVIKKHGNLPFDTVIGIFFPTFFAIGILIIGLLEGYRPELISFLFGNILAVTSQDMIISVVIGAAVLAVMLIIYRKFTFAMVDSQMAQVQGIPVFLLETVFLMALAAVVVASLKVLGIILVSALVIIPAAAARNVSKSMSETIAFSVLFSLVSVLVGLFGSFYFNVASGAAIVVVAAVIFLVTIPIKQFKNT